MPSGIKQPFFTCARRVMPPLGVSHIAYGDKNKA